MISNSLGICRLFYANSYKCFIVLQFVFSPFPFFAHLFVYVGKLKVIIHSDNQKVYILVYFSKM